MKQMDGDNMFDGMSLPDPGELKHQQEFKLPLLSYKKSSKVGLWLLALPLVFGFTILLKYELGISAAILNVIETAFTLMSDNSVLTYLIPAVFIGLPLLAMIMNLLAFCHFSSDKGTRELLVTIKCRPHNIILFLLSFAVLVYYLLPDALP